MSKSIIIDPGHGGTDPGASGHGIREKDWALEISLYQYKRLKELGARVGITRTDDRTLSSVPRTNLIKGKYDYCISNHWNAFNGSARGIETIHSIYGGKSFATNLANALVKATGLPLRRVFTQRGKSGDYYFMHRMTGSTTTVIIEYGFIDNKQDNAWFKNKDNFFKAAEAVIEVVCKQVGVRYVAPDGSITPQSKPTPSKPSSSKTIGVMADEVDKGLHGNGHANRQKSLGIDSATYAKVRAEVNRRAGIKPSKPKKSISQMATEVIAGKHGSGHANRRSSLGISQSEYNKVRAEVNRRAGVKTAPTQSVDQMANRILTSKGVPNGHEARRKWLGVDNATYQKVRAEVNRRLK